MSARIGKLFSDLSENCLRSERKYLSGSELKITMSEKYFVCPEKFGYVPKIFVCPEKFLPRKEILISGCSDSARSSDAPVYWILVCMSMLMSTPDFVLYMTILMCVLEYTQGRRNWGGGRRGSRPHCPLPGGAKGGKGALSIYRIALAK